jgi:hypothetical protein
MEKKNNIFNILNYKKKFSSKSKIFSSYIDIILEFLEYIVDNNSSKIANNEQFNFIINRGIDTLKHIFSILLLYTKNIKLVNFHCKKAYLYYVEFIGQIGEDSNSYLQLSSKDAILFVYKKTIFEINNEYKKKFCLEPEEKIFVNEIEKILQITNLATIQCFYKNNLNKENFNDKIKLLKIFYNKYHSHYIKKKKENELLLLFILNMHNKNLEFKKFFEYIICFITKINIKTVNKNNFMKKIYSKNNLIQFEKLSSTEYITWLRDK